jgi:hypothetical protein
MPKRNDDLFHRLRRVGIRKPVANTLSELTEDAGKKAASAGHRAVAELRALADEIERRLPTAELAETPAPPTAPTPSRPRPVRKLAAKAPVTQPRTTATTAKRVAPKPAAPKRAASEPAAPKAAASKSGAPAARASRGENKSKILTALKTGPQTASEISQTTGIATATVSTALTRLSKAGEVSKADRGYALPT